MPFATNKTPVVTLEQGMVIDGRYRVIQAIGEGGMGRVYVVRHVALDTKLALKTLLPGHAKRAHVARRFLREAKSASSLVHDHIVRVFDFGHLPTGEPYFVMELLEGQGLDELLAWRPRLRWREVQSIVVDVCCALECAHAAGMVHRDIKPANCFLQGTSVADYRVKVLDFGLAKSVDARSSEMSRDGSVVGTLSYMAPEQVEGRAMSHASDLYSVAAMMYRMLVGSSLYQTTSVPALLTEILRGDRPSAEWLTRTHGLHPEVSELLARNLSREPALRSNSAKEFADVVSAIEWSSHSFVDNQEPTRTYGGSVTCDELGRGEPPTTTGGTHTEASAMSSVSPAFSSKGRSRLKRFVVGLLVLGAILAVGSRLGIRHSDQKPAHSVRPATVPPIEIRASGSRTMGMPVTGQERDVPRASMPEDTADTVTERKDEGPQYNSELTSLSGVATPTVAKLSRKTIPSAAANAKSAMDGRPKPARSMAVGRPAVPPTPAAELALYDVAFRRVCSKYLPTDRHSASRFRFELKLDPDGRISQVHQVLPLSESPASMCIARRLRALRLRAQGGSSTRFSYSIEISPRD